MKFITYLSFTILVSFPVAARVPTAGDSAYGTAQTAVPEPTACVDFHGNLSDAGSDCSDFPIIEQKFQASDHGNLIDNEYVFNYYVQNESGLSDFSFKISTVNAFAFMPAPNGPYPFGIFTCPGDSFPPPYIVISTSQYLRATRSRMTTPA